MTTTTYVSGFGGGGERAPGDLEAVIGAARESVKPVELEVGKVHAVRDAGGGTKLVDLTGDEYRTAPARKRGTTTVRDVPSFLAYWGKHSDDASEVYADSTKLTVTAVLDAHTVDGPRWGGHRLVLALRKTPAWEAWAQRDGRLLRQEEFAEFLQDRLCDIKRPEAAHMLEVAQSIQTTTKVEFKAAARLVDGQRQLSYVEDTTAKAGGNGQLTIPEIFELGLLPFEGSEGYKLSARLRYRVSREGQLTIGYRLDRPEDVLEAAFKDVVDALGEQLGEGRVLNGTPAN